MLTNQLPVRPDSGGDLLQQTAAAIVAIDQHAVVPHDVRSARQMLAELQQKQGAPRESSEDRRLLQLHEVYNAALAPLAKAKRLGIRARSEKPPVLPEGAFPDDLQRMAEYSAQLEFDIADFELKTPEQRRIERLEARLTKVVTHANSLVTTILDHAKRIERLEAIIQGPQQL